MCVDGALIAGGHGLQDHVVGTVAGRGNQCGVISGTFTRLMLGDRSAADFFTKEITTNSEVSTMIAKDENIQENSKSSGG